MTISLILPKEAMITKIAPNITKMDTAIALGIILVYYARKYGGIKCERQNYFFKENNGGNELYCSYVCDTDCKLGMCMDFSSAEIP